MAALANATMVDDVARAPARPHAPLTFDVSRMHIGAGGVEPFLWPVARQELETVRDTFMTELAKAGRNLLQFGDERGLLFEILALQWAMSVMSAFQAGALIRRLETAGTAFEVPVYSTMLGPLMAGRTPGPERYVRRLIEGPQTSSLLHASLRELRNTLVDRIVRRRSFWRNSMQDAIVSVTTGPIIENQALSLSAPVYYLPHAVWFHKPAADEFYRGMKALGRAVDIALDAAMGAFAAVGADPGMLARSWLKEQFSLSLAGVEIYSQQLLTRIDRLPRRLWTGSNGNPYTRLLRRAVRARGGTVVGHDHGNGSGLFIEPSIPPLEFIDCDRFVTFTRAHAATLRQLPGSEWLVRPQAPDIVVAAPPVTRQVSSATARTSRRGKLRILYMDPMFTGDRVTQFAPHRSDLVALDWVGRLIGVLQSWGHEVSYKAHPGSVISLPDEVATKLGVAVVRSAFEDVFQDYDLILFDDPHSSTLPICLRSDKDVVIIDTGFFAWSPGAREMLEKRCPIVASRWGSDNRQNVVWDELNKAIVEARSRRDPAFIDAYFSAAA